jgi:hypothetical protein
MSSPEFLHRDVMLIDDKCIPSSTYITTDRFCACQCYKVISSKHVLTVTSLLEQWFKRLLAIIYCVLVGIAEDMECQGWEIWTRLWI